MSPPDTLAALQAENARLIALLDAHGIEWRLPQPTGLVVRAPESSRLSTAEKVVLFRRLFRGRADVYPVAGRARPRANQATRLPVPTSGAPVSAKSRALNAAIAASAC